jgi:iron complex outermembrane recepter protein
MKYYEKSAVVHKALRRGQLLLLGTALMPALAVAEPDAATTAQSTAHATRSTSAHGTRAAAAPSPAPTTTNTSATAQGARASSAPVRPAASAPASSGESIVVTGTRETGRRARDSLSPIDVVSHQQLAATGQPTLRDALSLLLPSLTTPTGGFDTGALTDTISLRGLNPNETLVLVDGKRRHSTANIYADPGPQQGSTAPDIDMIPMAAIDHVEVLRDGASAQYGSDAVAGVVNIILKKQPSGFHAQSISGITSEGDGFQQGVYLDGGLKLGSRGWAHISGDFVHMDPTYRSARDNRTNTYVNNILGQPEQTRETVAINAGYDLTDAIQLYGDATYGHRHAQSYQNYRLPSSLSAYPGYAALYPYGYSPLETLNENDVEVKAGLRGEYSGWHWDLSSVYARDFDDIGLENSTNTALYAATGRTPTSFDVMGFNNTTITNNFDLSRRLHFGFWPYAINVAGGAEYRYEAYSVGTGSPDSISTPYGYGSGADALPGTNPANAGNSNRDVTAGYLDLSTHLTRAWQVDLAGRYEHYSDVGNTQTGKIATRYDVNRRLGFRATISNGFHAPTLAQEHYSALNVSPTAARGLIAVNSPGAVANGASALKPERSTNVEGGVIAEPIQNLHVTADVYQIDLRDRILPGGSIVGSAAQSALALDGFSLPASAATWGSGAVSANWFANVASTRTQGLDLTATYLTRLGNYGRIDWDAAINLNRTRLRHQSDSASGAPLLDAQSIAYLTTAYPRSKIIFGGRWTQNRWTVGLHEIRWGQTTDELTWYAGPLALNGNHIYRQWHNEPRWTTNLEVSYRVTDRWTATLGGNNIFASYPTKVPAANRYLGAPQYYPSTSQLGINGGFYYLRVNYDL